MRFSLTQQKALTDRFVTYLEEAMNRQAEINECFQPALEELTQCVRDNSQLLTRIAERVKV